MKMKLNLWFFGSPKWNFISNHAFMQFKRKPQRNSCKVVWIYHIKATIFYYINANVTWTHKNILVRNALSSTRICGCISICYTCIHHDDDHLWSRSKALTDEYALCCCYHLNLNKLWTFPRIDLMFSDSWDLKTRMAKWNFIKIQPKNHMTITTHKLWEEYSWQKLNS